MIDTPIVRDMAAPEPPPFFQKVIGYFLTGATVAAALLFAFWTLYPYQPLTLLNHPFEVSNKILRAGDVLTYHSDYCKGMNLAAQVTRSFIDGIKYDLPVTSTDNPVGCHELYPTITVPNIPPGQYKLAILYQYTVNPIRLISIHAETETFTIIK